ncbi:uncharacterized protein N7496_006083 [Penicillium cataractarum]|uniref:Uncharacterized protein n=1 Tax=Penicillium cataractarum TaxID=2100454 RepID=A0A9W9S0W2_9EURO|nr:uncharacterized protein N7496_006083 [Penicillium cataractarum]KAJ5369991.1 hypothetical protein N7496_006083 [Penicillium cataractarum]
MCNAELSGDNKKAILHSPSISSFSSSSFTNTSYTLYPLSEPKVDQALEYEELGFKCWRKDEIEVLQLQGDEISISRLCRFGLYNDDFADMMGLPKVSPQTQDSLTFSMDWDLDLPQWLRDGPKAVASTLSEKSHSKFKRIGFEEIVRFAYGLYSGAVAHFLWQYELLCVILYWKFGRNDGHRRFLLQLRECLEETKADPFLYAATATAWEIDSTAQTKTVCIRLETALNLIASPLRQTLKKPDSAQVILRELEDSMLRFYGHFYAAKVDWDVPFDDRTKALGRLKHIGVFALGQVLSGEDYAFYKQLGTQSAKLDHQELCSINNRWNRLCHSVKEYIDTGIVSDLEMNSLAQEFHHHRNFFSFTAVIIGMKASQSRADAEQQHSYLLDPSRDYDLVASLRYMSELCPVNGFASLDETKGPHPSSTGNAFEDTGIMSSMRDLVRQIFLGDSVFGCFGR